VYWITVMKNSAYPLASFELDIVGTQMMKLKKHKHKSMINNREQLDL
jgi:hypothetical protein